MATLSLYGHVIHNQSMVQVKPGFAPMQVNTSIGILLGTFSLLFIVIEKKNISKITACAGFILGVLTLLQYILHIDLSIDELFSKAQFHTKTSHPGRMAPNTALCLTLISSAAFLLYYKNILAMSLSVAVLVITFIGFLGYLVPSEGLYGWASLTRMAIHTTLSYFILSVCFCSICLKTYKNTSFDIWQIIPFLISTTLLVLTFFTWFVIEEGLKDKKQNYFYDLVSDTEDVFKDRFNLYEKTLRGGLGLFYASEKVTYSDWRKYIQTIELEKNLPGVNGLGYIDKVPAPELDQYLKAVRSKEQKDFQIHPNTNRSDKYIIRYILPFERNKEAVGLDIGFEDNRYNAARKAAQLGKPVLTEKIELVQDKQKQAGFLLLAPFYKTKTFPDSVEKRKEALQGWVYAPFIAANFFANIDKANNHQLDIFVFDNSKIAEKNLIFTNSKSSYNFENLKNTHSSEFNIAEKTWTILWLRNDNFQSPGGGYIGLGVLFLGVFLTSCVYITFSQLVSQKLQIEKKVEEQTRKLQEAWDFQKLVDKNIPDYLFIKDSKFRIVSANDLFLKLYPKDAQNKIIGYTTIESFSRKDADAFLENDKRALLDGYSEVEETLTMPKGDIKTLYTKKVRFEDSKGQKFILGISRDITEMKNTQRDIVKVNSDLKRSNQELEQFAYIASHDLQEPLRKIGGFTERLEKQLEGQLDEKCQTYVDFITSGVDRMRDLIQGLLSYSRVTTSKEDIVSLKVNDVIQNSMTNISELIKENNAQIYYEDLPVIKYDKIMLQQIFQNLITNAIKYRRDKSPDIKISAHRKKECWQFSVEDNGMGIEENQLDRIFEMFQRLHSKEDIEGTGIGLSLCQKIIEKYGGNMWATSKPGVGSIFYFTIVSDLTVENTK